MNRTTWPPWGGRGLSGLGRLRSTAFAVQAMISFTTEASFSPASVRP
jgi:hypothetical protein